MHDFLKKPLFKNDQTLVRNILTYVKTPEHLLHIITMYEAFYPNTEAYRFALGLALHTPNKKYPNDFYQALTLCTKNGFPTHELTSYPQSAEHLVSSGFFELLSAKDNDNARSALANILSNLKEWQKLFNVLNSIQKNFKSTLSGMKDSDIENIRKALPHSEAITHFISKLGALGIDAPNSLDVILACAPFSQLCFRCIEHGEGGNKVANAILTLIANNLEHREQIEKLMADYHSDYGVPLTPYAVQTIITKQLQDTLKKTVSIPSQGQAQQSQSPKETAIHWYRFPFGTFKDTGTFKEKQNPSNAAKVDNSSEGLRPS
jgi:hypothetical protein